MHRHLVVACLALFCIAQVLSEQSVDDCPRELQRLKDLNAELADTLRNTTDYMEEFMREFNSFFSEMTATRRPATTRAPAPARRP